MPTEDRYIVFNYEEVYKALRMRTIVEDAEMLPSGKVTKIQLPNEPGEKIHAMIKTDEGIDKTLEFTQEFFALSLVFFCQGSNIPIPRAGRKSLVAKDDKIVMHIQILG